MKPLEHSESSELKIISDCISQIPATF